MELKEREVGRRCALAHLNSGDVAMQTLWQDLRFAVRMLKKNPGFAAVAVLTLAVAIGANAVVFSVMNGLILRTLNVPQPESLYTLEHGSDKDASESYPDYLDLRDRNRSFDSLIAFNIDQAALDTGKNPSRAWVYEVSGNYFDALGIQPYLGRLIHPSDEHSPDIVLTYAYWHSHFQDDRSVVGRVLHLNSHPFTVIGVTPPGFRGTVLIFSPDFFVPIVNQEQGEAANLLNARGNRWISEVLGHVKAGVTPAQAVADLNSIGSALEKSYPKEDAQMSFSLERSGLPGGGFGAAVQAFVGGLMLLAGLILLAACANLGSLFAARAADRSREVALRLALGAGRTRILRQLFTEALLISLMGGAAGLWGSVGLLRWLAVWQPFPQYPISMPVNPDATVYGVALLLSVVSGFLFGAVPVKQVLRTDPYQIIKSGSTGSVGRRLTVRDLLLGAQVAICAVLVTSSIVAVRGLARSLHSNFGFEPRDAMLVDIDLNMAGYKPDRVPVMQKRMLDAMASISGVTSVGLVNLPPLQPACCSEANIFYDKTADLRPSNVAARVITFSISPEYLQVAGTPLLAGRDLTWHDDKNAPRVAVVNRLFADRMFGSAANALGGYYKLDDGTRVHVVGIVEDGKYSPNITEDPRLAMFVPIMQSPSTETWLVVRLSANSRQLAAAIRTKLRDLDAALPTFVQTWSEAMDGALFPSRMAALSLGVLGAMGAILSITGIFGLAAYSVTKRLRELGIRMALGAQRKEVLQAALGRAFKLLAFGSTAGLLLGILAGRVLALIVYQATPRDPFVLIGTVLAMSLLGLVATWIPAQRALSIDPAILLREE
jgi:predicted permease